MIPVYCDMDVVVVGASSGAVAAALEIRRHGRRVMAVSDLSYFGEESAGALNLFGRDPAPAFPCAVKRDLESALLQANIPFFYLLRPVALLRDEDGRLAGIILAARTALFAVTCRTVLDATRYGVVARLAKAPFTQRTELPQKLGWTVLSDGVPEGWANKAEKLLPPFRSGESTFGAYRLQVERFGEPVAREHLLRASLQAGNIFITADIVPDVPAEFCGTRLKATLSDADFSPLPDLFLLNGLLPLDLPGVQALERCEIQETIGRRVGALAAAVSRPAKRIVETRGDYRFAPVFLRQSMGQLDFSPADFPRIGRCDVAVVGGGTGGAPAGIASARDGAKTVVLEIQHMLGGVSTVGLIAKYWFGNPVGFTSELDEAVRRVDREYRPGTSDWRPEIKAAVYHRLLHDAGGEAWLGSYAFGVCLDGNRVDGLLVSTPFGAGLLEAGCVVDASGNADVAAAAGAPCCVIGAQHVATQGAGLTPRLHPGVRANNTDHTFVDETDPEGITHAMANARAKFPQAFDTSPLVGTRERRQICGDYELSPLDILAERTFPDTIYTAISDFDTHGFIVHPLFMVAIPEHHKQLRAHVPFRCMLPKGIEGVLVTGLGMSAHRDALPVIRMQADVQNQGFAAGLAAATAAKGSRRVRDLDIRALQRRLAAIGNLAADVPTHADSFPIKPEAIRAAAAGKLTMAMNAAILFAYPEQSRPLLANVLLESSIERRIDAALILGLMGCREAAPILTAAVRDHAWDEGWNYRGMGQSGASMSRLDALIIALARTDETEGVAVIEEKIRQLDGRAPFSHCRAVAIAAGLLRNSRLNRALADLLNQPGMQGHAQRDSAAVIRKANGDPVETEARNLSLRELYLARGLYLAGDIDGLGRGILEDYSRDLRGHYARHARAVLADDPIAIAPLEFA